MAQEGRSIGKYKAKIVKRRQNVEGNQQLKGDGRGSVSRAIGRRLLGGTTGCEAMKFSAESLLHKNL